VSPWVPTALDAEPACPGASDGFWGLAKAETQAAHRVHISRPSGWCEHPIRLTGRNDGDTVAVMMFGRRAAQGGSTLRIVEARATGYPSQNVVGESQYGPALQKIGRRLGGGPEGEAMTTAVLVPEPQNKYDPNAVAVNVDGATVGYLPREHAASYSPVLLALAATGVAVSVPARVWWGSGYEGDPIASVRLDLGPPGMLVPVNAPPSRSAMQLPPGGAMQVTGEDQHLDVLAPFVSSAGQAAAIASLHEVTEQKARSSKQVLEVRIDDRPVGRLSAAMSEHLLAAVREAQRCGIVLYVRARVHGNALKAEVTIYPTKTAELSQAWIDELGTHSIAAGPATQDPAPGADLSEPERAHVEALPPAAWYRNPSGPGLRWWDGSTWTEHTRDQ
jgi:hypothetical protein